MNKEDWRPLPGFNDHYEVNYLGEVRSVSRMIIRNNGRKLFRKGKVLKVCLKGDYAQYTIRRSPSVPFSLKRSRAIAIAFIPQVDGKNIVNHINGNKQDDRIENLEWVTHAENIQHAVREGFFKPGKTMIEKSKKAVIQLTLDGDFIKEWASISEAGKSLGINADGISANACGQSKSSGGFKWVLKTKYYE